LERFGRVDILVNNAGSTSNAGPLHEMTNKTWDETMDVFLPGCSGSPVASFRTWSNKEGVPS
jgi:NAD(P)-dependent dehydrogenase (short-subunit alcohol dehydrogenase family)